MNEINDISDPEKSTLESRRQERCESEDSKFDEDYYAMDFINDEEIQHVIQFKTMWYKELRRVQKDAKEKQTKGPSFYHITLLLTNFDILKFDFFYWISSSIDTRGRRTRQCRWIIGYEIPFNYRFS